MARGKVGSGVLDCFQAVENVPRKFCFSLIFTHFLLFLLTEQVAEAYRPNCLAPACFGSDGKEEEKEQACSRSIQGGHPLHQPLSDQCSASTVRAVSFVPRPSRRFYRTPVLAANRRRRASLPLHPSLPSGADVFISRRLCRF